MVICKAFPACTSQREIPLDCSLTANPFGAGCLTGHWEDHAWGPQGPRHPSCCSFSIWWLGTAAEFLAPSCYRSLRGSAQLKAQREERKSWSRSSLTIQEVVKKHRANTWAAPALLGKGDALRRLLPWLLEHTEMFQEVEMHRAQTSQVLWGSTRHQDTAPTQRHQTPLNQSNYFTWTNLSL